MTASAIRVKAVAVIRRGSDILLSFAIDPDNGSRYGRLLGGGVEPGERADQAVRRELREEIGAGLTAVRRLGVLENLFTWQGRLHHEVIFVFAAEFEDPLLYDRDSFPVAEALCDGPAVWVSVEQICAGDVTVYPAETRRLLGEPTSPRRISSNPV